MQNVTGQFVIIIWLPTECMFFFIIETYWKGDETNENIAVVGNKIKVPKLGLVWFAKSHEVNGRTLNATVKWSPFGEYFVSLLVEIEVQEFLKTYSSIRINLELEDFAILLDRKIYKNPKFFRSLEEKLTKVQRILSRKTRGSSRWNKQRVMVASITWAKPQMKLSKTTMLVV